MIRWLKPYLLAVLGLMIGAIGMLGRIDLLLFSWADWLALFTCVKCFARANYFFFYLIFLLCGLTFFPWDDWFAWAD